MIYHKVIDTLDEITDETFSLLLASISEQRREKVLRFKFASGRRQSLMAYVTLKELLRQHYGLSGNPIFKETENGKPEIVGFVEEGREETIPHESPSLRFPYFNISHSHDAIAVAVSDEPIGIDIEIIPENVKDDLCRYVFNEEECSRVFSSQRAAYEFALLWTMKEAFVKLSGEGISGKEQLRPLLTNTSAYNFHSLLSPNGKYVVTWVAGK